MAVNPANGNGLKNKKPFVERFVLWIGSVSSLIIHTILYALVFVTGFLHWFPWDMVLLVFTTIISMEAIYLSLFIQITVNRHQKELEEVSEDVEDIQEDIQEISEDVEDLGDDVEDIQEDIQELTEEEQSEEERKKKQLVSLEQLTSDVQRVLKDLETLKKQ